MAWKSFVVGGLLAAYSFGVTAVCAETFAEEADRTRQEIINVLETQRKQGNNSEETRALRNALRGIDETRRYLDLGDDGSAVRELAQAGEAEDLPTTTRTEMAGLLTQAQAEKTDREKAFLARVNAACQRLSETATKAKEAKELDGALQELGQLSKNRLATGLLYNDMQNKLRVAMTFANHWQDYLADSQHSERTANVITNLRTLANDSEATAFVPRSEILARLASYETRNLNGEPPQSSQQINTRVRAILQKTKTLDDLSDSVDQLLALQKAIVSGATFFVGGGSVVSRPSYNLNGNSLLETSLFALDEMCSRYREFRSGLEVHLALRDGDHGTNKSPELETTLLPLRVQLLRLAFPRLLHVGKDDQPGADEAPADFLNRYIREAKGRQDWAATMRGLELRQALSVERSTLSVSQEQAISAFRDFLAAINLEEAKCDEQAVAVYFTALRSGQEDLPAAFIGERLAAIRKEHPSEYATGMRQVFPVPTTPSEAAPIHSADVSPSGISEPGQERPDDAREMLDDAKKLVVPATTPAPGAVPNPSASPGPSVNPH